MTTEQRTAFVASQTACMLAEMYGMVAENQQRVILGQSMAYNDERFFELAVKYGLDHNSVIATLEGV